jgi:hypothetical protein
MIKLIFNHSLSIFKDKHPLIYLEAEAADESAKYMFENGWIPYGKNNKWYQTKSSRLKLFSISKKRQNSLKSLKITESTSNSNIEIPIDIENYNGGNYLDFFFDDVFWGRVNFYEDQILYSVMNNIKNKKSYGTLSFYYLIERFKDQYKYLYIADYFDCFNYKKNLQGFEYWDGKNWI